MGLGCMGMSEFYGPADPAAARATLDAALDLGIDFLDTADMYGRGANEELIGAWLRLRRARVTIATKFGILRSDDPDARPVDTRPEYVRRACEASLRRLGVETIDLYYMHRRAREVPIEDTVGAMAALVAEGKVRAIGLCEVSVETLARAHAVHPVAAVQSELSLWSRDQEREVLPWCRAQGVAFVAYSPLGRGALTAAPPRPEALEDDDFRRSIPRFAPENWARNRPALDALSAFAAERGRTPAQVALAWIINRHGAIPIPGTRSPARLAENAAAADLALAPEDMARLEAIFAPGRIAGHRSTAAGRPLLGL
jgi:aryl-alcohol dehydrogenase-like predicted oxidoreductase